MKNQFIIIPFALVTLTSAQSEARKDYAAICRADPPKTAKTFDNGYEVEYVCDSAGDSETLISSSTVSSSDECAQSCKSIKGCKASDWFYNTGLCNTYSSASVGDVVTGSVFMKRLSPEEPVDDEADEDAEKCKKKLQGCLAEKDDMKDDLDKCKKDLQSCLAGKDDLQDELKMCQEAWEKEKKECDTKKKDLETKLATCRKEVEAHKPDPVWERRKAAMKICGYGGRKTITSGKYTYTAHCQRTVAPTSNFYRQAALSVDDCLAECSKDPKCKAIHYVIMNDAHCKFLGAASDKPRPVAEEGDCPRSPMIGFLPSPRK
ncbi:hypothetical protein QQS21_001355 [Conoideocrella luteorostrata]|uniref:Apple domain-containing protein n=1 Tax=Conoideocrella luteorostrata TaxID=1105319 RepID=A0AAJ0G226_9HYPO|nr:hypothetical protein QQS21_001355 [Conoideocrella luteorostrata]